MDMDMLCLSLLSKVYAFWGLRRLQPCYAGHATEMEEGARSWAEFLVQLWLTEHEAARSPADVTTVLGTHILPLGRHDPSDSLSELYDPSPVNTPALRLGQLSEEDEITSSSC